MKFDDVHGSHGQTGPVNKTADVAVQLDVVERMSGGLHLSGVGLSRVLIIVLNTVITILKLYFIPPSQRLVSV